MYAIMIYFVESFWSEDECWDHWLKYASNQRRAGRVISILTYHDLTVVLQSTMQYLLKGIDDQPHLLWCQGSGRQAK